MGRQSRATVEREYDWTVPAARLAALYADVKTPGSATIHGYAVSEPAG